VGERGEAPKFLGSLPPGFRVRGIEGFEKIGTRWDGRRRGGEARWGEDDDSAARGVREWKWRE
jgi:hypothetical protein